MFGRVRSCRLLFRVPALGMFYLGARRSGCGGKAEVWGRSASLICELLSQIG